MMRYRLHVFENNPYIVPTLQSGHCFIYRLYCNDMCVYVGKTQAIQKRIYDHSRKKEFDSFELFQTPIKGSNDIEAFEIVKMNPPLNRILPSNSKYIKLSELRNNIYKAVEENIDTTKCAFIGWKDCEREIYYFDRSEIDGIVSNVVKNLTKKEG